MQNPKPTTQSSPIALQLARLMREHNLSASELARKTGVPQPTIHRLLHAENTDPRVSTLATLASYFEVPTDYFLGNLDQQAIHSTHAVPIYNLADLRYPLSELPTSEHSLILSGLSINCFAVHSTPSMHPKVPARSLVIIDPTQSAQDGDLVLVFYHQSKHYSVQDLIQDGTRQALRSLNSASMEDLSPDTMTIVGCAVQITTQL